MKKFTGKTLKKICISFGIIFIILLTISCVWACGVKKENTEYLRIHVRANSNSDEDQRVKYLVRDAIVEKLTPLVAECVNDGTDNDIDVGLLIGVHGTFVK